MYIIIVSGLLSCAQARARMALTSSLLAGGRTGSQAHAGAAVRQHASGGALLCGRHCSWECHRERSQPPLRGSLEHRGPFVGANATDIREHLTHQVNACLTYDVHLFGEEFGKFLIPHAGKGFNST